jgi:hypothetical protein
VSEPREVIAALQSKAEFEAAVSELGAAGIDRARISFLAQEEIAASCADAVGCDIKQLPRVEIGLSDDRQQVRTIATSRAATVASFAGGDWRSDRAGSAGRVGFRGSVGGLAALFGQRLPRDRQLGGSRVSSRRNCGNGNDNSTAFPNGWHET